MEGNCVADDILCGDTGSDTIDGGSARTSGCWKARRASKGPDGIGTPSLACASGEPMAKEDPNDAHKQIALMLALARCGHHKRAAETADSLGESALEDPAILFYVACAMTPATSWW